MKLLFATIVTLLLFYSCSKSEDIYKSSIPNNLLTEYKSNFHKDSMIYYQKFDKKNYSYRQSLKRNIYWEQAKKVRDTIVVPVVLQLPKGTIDIKTGKNILNHKVYLTISKDKNDRYTYEMITFIGNNSISKK